MKSGPAVNLTKVSPIPQKKTISYINNFVINTTQFLNRFSYVCENKLREVSTDISRIEIMLAILEAKLASIPGLDGVTPETVAQLQNPPQDPNYQPPPPPVDAPEYIFSLLLPILTKLHINVTIGTQTMH